VTTSVPAANRLPACPKQTMKRLRTGRDDEPSTHPDVATIVLRRRHIGTVMAEAANRDLRDHLSRYLERVQAVRS
jgi:hypothetical protein